MSIQTQRTAGPVGYGWLRDRLLAPSFLVRRQARAASVNALVRSPDGGLLVPSRMIPGSSVLEHSIFALKHEGVDLHLLALAMHEISSQELQHAFEQTPNGIYIRQACALWERIRGQELQVSSGTITAPYQPLFDPQQYITGTSRRNSKWRIDFNGLGDIDFCPVVRRTPVLQKHLEQDVLLQAAEFAKNTQSAMLERAIQWAYLSETEGSFAIEGEVPSQQKAAAFANLLKHAGQIKTLDEDVLSELQNIAITNPLDLAVAYRTEQNRLQRGRGAAGVKYVPPAPEHVPQLMAGLLEFINNRPPGVPALVHAAVASFGFVLIHPFMDGNGRLSRFLIHHSLGQSGQLPTAFVLPVSMAMKRHEDEYLAALQSFSEPARELCQVTWIDGVEFDYEWQSSAEYAFRFMDLTQCTEFTLQMAQVALEEDLVRETEWLADFDHVFNAIKAEFDVRDQDLSNLIQFAFDQGQLSNNRRKQYSERVPSATLDAIESCAKACLSRKQSDEMRHGSSHAQRGG